MFCVYISGCCDSLNRHSCTWKNSQHSPDDYQMSHVGYHENQCRSWQPSLLPESHVLSYFDSTFLSWVIYCGYSRPRGCLLSAHQTQMWCLWTADHKKSTRSFNLVKVCCSILSLISRTNCLNYQEFFLYHLYVCITYTWMVKCHHFLFVLTDDMSFIERTCATVT